MSNNAIGLKTNREENWLTKTKYVCFKKKINKITCKKIWLKCENINATGKDFEICVCESMQIYINGKIYYIGYNKKKKHFYTCI